ncbi:MAG TPA: DUF1697 domain-containing protein [Candidatus Polarisedimenticolia bacterium]|nr:DUF1697 domain-containing protein [Candidatus Polarisedimenticolia bacterium]
MRTWIALFRGINVTGNNMLPMKDLKTLMEKNGCRDVRTYIASGNVVFRSALKDPGDIEKRLTAVVEKKHGFAPRVLALTSDDLEKAAAGNPFPEARADHKSVHVFFLAASPSGPDTDGLERLRAPSERFALKGRFFYLHTPQGFGTSKLAKGAEKLLGVAATARNWRTVTTLIDMTTSVD